MANLDQLWTSGSWVFLTGAGVSAESGIPTFRGEEGYWTVGSREYRPTELATRAAFSSIPWEVWGWYLYRRAVCRAAAPNAAHIRLVQAQQALGERFQLVTQNVDGLHLRAGSHSHFEIHGNIDHMRCWNECCARSWPIPFGPAFERGSAVSSELQAQLVCPSCQGLARPHILWFDECYSEELFRYTSSQQVASGCDVFVSIGTSGQTNLPMQMGRLALKNGAYCVDINPERNPFSEVASASCGLHLARSASSGLQQLFEAAGFVNRESTNP